MKTLPGKGFLIRTGIDAPFAGWMGVRQLDAALSLTAAPWDALRALTDLTRLLPGGLAILWNAPVEWIAELPPEVRAGFWKTLSNLPGLSLHVRSEAVANLLQEPAQVWFHAPRPPAGDLGLAWRQGLLGWVRDPGSGWALPGLGLSLGMEHTEPEDIPASFLWGELLLPVGALEHLSAAELALPMAEAQGQAERALSLRLGAEAWPAVMPFHRRRAGWRIGLLGGREYQQSGASWDRAAVLAADLATALEKALRCPIHTGVSGDPLAAAELGRQAMGEALPWRNALPLPPQPPFFTPGLGADLREPVPLEARCAFPAAMAPVLRDPPVVHLRVPAVPLEGAVAGFLGSMTHPPAIRWLPPELPPPGPFLPERAWAPASAYPALADTTQALQPSLFEGLD